MTILYLVEALASSGSALLTLGIFFYTTHHFGWGLTRNLSLAAAQGVVYTAGALLANRVAARFGRRRGLAGLYAILAVVCAILAASSSHERAVAVLLLVYMFFLALNWPMIESLVASDCPPERLSRRIGLYNAIWSGTVAIALATAGTVIQYWPKGVFILPLLFHGGSTILMLLVQPRAGESTTSEPAVAHPAPEPELLHSRTLALWLSRISLPAMYVVNYGLSAMLPLLPVMKPLSPSMQTALGSVWVISRWLAFLLLWATVFWHTRPRLLVGAAALMLLSFIAVTVPIPGGGWRLDLATMIGGQITLGLAMGLIYTASLYFGMVLSEGSTEHGGYHEALIGLGSVLGPGAGAITQLYWPGDVRAVTAAIGSIVGISLLASTAASLLRCENGGLRDGPGGV